MAQADQQHGRARRRGRSAPPRSGLGDDRLPVDGVRPGLQGARTDGGLPGGCRSQRDAYGGRYRAQSRRERRRPHAGSRGRRGSRRGCRGASAQASQVLRRSGVCSWGCSSAAPRSAAARQPSGRADRGLVGGERDRSSAASRRHGGTEKVERRATTGEAARRRGESYTRPGPPCVHPRCGDSVDRPDGRGRKSAFSPTSALSTVVQVLSAGTDAATTDRTAVEDRWPSRPRPTPRRRTDAGTCAGDHPAQDATLLERALFEVKRVIVGPGPDGRADVRGAARPRALPARGRARRGQDPRRGDPRQGRRRHLRPDPVHPRPGARRHRRHPDLPAVEREVRRRAGPGVRQLPARRRDQPGARPRCSRRCWR